MVAATFIGVFLIYLLSIQETLTICLYDGSSTENPANEGRLILVAESIASSVDSDLLRNSKKGHVVYSDNESKELTSSVFDKNIESSVDPDFGGSFENDYDDLNYCSVQMPTPNTENEANQNIYIGSGQNSTDSMFNSDKKSSLDENCGSGNLHRTQWDIQLNNTDQTTVSGYTMDAGYSSVSIQKAAEFQPVEYCADEPPKDQNVVLQQSLCMKKATHDIPHDESEENNMLEEGIKKVECNSISLESVEEAENNNIYVDNHPMSFENKRIVKKSNAIIEKGNENLQTYQQTNSCLEYNISGASTVGDGLSVGIVKNSTNHTTHHGNIGFKVDKTTRILNESTIQEDDHLKYSRNDQIIQKLDAINETANKKIINESDPGCEKYNTSENSTGVDDFNLVNNKSSQDKNTTFPGKNDLADNITTEGPKYLNSKDYGHCESLSNNRIAENISRASMKIDDMNLVRNNSSKDNIRANVDLVDNVNIEILNGPDIKKDVIKIVSDSTNIISKKLNITEEKDQRNLRKSEEKMEPNVSLISSLNVKTNETKNKESLNITKEGTHKTNQTSNIKTEKNTNESTPVPVKSEITQDNEEQLDITTLLKIFTPEDVMSMLLNSRPKQEKTPKPKADPNTLPKHAIIRRDRLKQAIDIAKYTMEKYADMLQ